MARAKANEGIFLGESGIELVVALEVTFVEHLNGILLSRCAMCTVYHLRSVARKQGSAKRRNGKRTVE